MGKSLRGGVGVGVPRCNARVDVRRSSSGQRTAHAKRSHWINLGQAEYRGPGRAADRTLISCCLVQMESRRWAICQFGPCGQSRLPFGPVRGSRFSRLARSPGYSIAYCGHARRRRRIRDASWHTDNRSSLQLRGDEQSDPDRGSGVGAREGRATSRLRPLPLGSSMSRVDFLRQRALLTSLRGGSGHGPAFAVGDVVPRHATPAIFRCDLVPGGVPRIPAVMIAHETADLFAYADNRCGV